MECPHNEPYMCPRCGKCFPCVHKLEWRGELWAWICEDGVKIRVDSGGDWKLVEWK
jgi:hypothetical protein